MRSYCAKGLYMTSALLLCKLEHTLPLPDVREREIVVSNPSVASSGRCVGSRCINTVGGLIGGRVS